MTSVRFAAWVEPVASQLRESRREVIEFVRARDAFFWPKPSVVEGWTNHDLLAHIGRGNDQMLQDILRAVVAGREVPNEVLEPDTDAENERRVAERRAWAVQRVISELEEAGAEMQELLAGLRAEHAELHPAGASWTLEGLLQVVLAEDHDREHLDQLRQGLDSEAEALVADRLRAEHA
jgi:hypothetical protein